MSTAEIIPPTTSGAEARPPADHVTYDDAIVRRFVFASVLWGAVGMLVGVLIASQLAFHELNLGAYLQFGRLRPLHTNAVIFAFVGNSIFAGIYYSTQRLLKVRTVDVLSRIHFWAGSSSSSPPRSPCRWG